MVLELHLMYIPRTTDSGCWTKLFWFPLFSVAPDLATVLASACLVSSKIANGPSGSTSTFPLEVHLGKELVFPLCSALLRKGCGLRWGFVFSWGSFLSSFWISYKDEWFIYYSIIYVSVGKGGLEFPNLQSCWLYAMCSDFQSVVFARMTILWTW